MSIQLDKQSLLKNAIKLALPISLQSMLAASFHLVDTAMVVRLGSVPTAALGVSGRWFFMLNLIFFGFASGMSVLVSQYWGIKDIKTIRKSFGLGIMSTFISGCIFSLILFAFTPQMLGIFRVETNVIAEGVKYMRIACWTYIPMSLAFIYSNLLRSTENVILALVITIFSVVLNTGLNLLLIFGNFGFPQMGIRGAAISNNLYPTTFQMLIIISVSYIKKNVAAAKIRELFDFDKSFVKKYYLLALPVLANEVLWALGVNVYNMVLGRLWAVRTMRHLQYTAL